MFLYPNDKEWEVETLRKIAEKVPVELAALQYYLENKDSRSLKKQERQLLKSSLVIQWGNDHAERVII